MTTSVIELRGLARTYPGPPPVPAMRPADLIIEAGDYVAVTGPSGSGKSTLLHLLGLLDAPTAGSYLLDELRVLAGRHPGLITNARGRGLMCAIDLPDGGVRDHVITLLRDRQVLVLACGERTIRFRPALCVTTGELQTGVRAIDGVLSGLTAAARP